MFLAAAWLNHQGLNLGSLDPESLVIGGVKRTFLVHRATPSSPNAPLLFVFHGHFGTSRNAARSMPFAKDWPAANVIYPQGLPTASYYDHSGKGNGWQKKPGDDGDRDLKFFDAMVDWSKQNLKFNPTRIYVAGHSNGAGFSLQLWAARGSEIYAVGSLCAVYPDVAALVPKNLFFARGKTDTVVPPKWTTPMVNALDRIFNPSGPGTPFGTSGTLYNCGPGVKYVDENYDGGHKFPQFVYQDLLKFFQSIQ